MLESAPLAERIGLAALAKRHEGALISGGRTASTPLEPQMDEKASPEDWQIGSRMCALCSQLARHVALARSRAFAPAKGRHFFFNSESFGSEVYGLIVARGLQSAARTYKYSVRKRAIRRDFPTPVR